MVDKESLIEFKIKINKMAMYPMCIVYQCITLYRHLHTRFVYYELYMHNISWEEDKPWKLTLSLEYLFQYCSDEPRLV